MKELQSTLALQHLECSPMECNMALHLSFHSALQPVECHSNPAIQNGLDFWIGALRGVPIQMPWLHLWELSCYRDMRTILFLRKILYERVKPQKKNRRGRKSAIYFSPHLESLPLLFITRSHIHRSANICMGEERRARVLETCRRYVAMDR